jgi:sugar transferase (PEP-CTERM system associated)
VSARHYSPRHVAIVVAEQTCILLTLALAIGLDLGGARVQQLLPQVAFAALLYLSGFYYSDLYNFEGLEQRQELITAALRAFSGLAVLFGIIFLFTEWLRFHSTTILVHLPGAILFVLLIRPHIDSWLTRRGVVTRIVVVGTGRQARQIAEQIIRKRESGQLVFCFVTTEEGSEPSQLRLPGEPDSFIPVIPASKLTELAARHRIKRILVATGDLGPSLPVDTLLHCKAQGYEVLDGHTFFERLLGRIFIADLSPQWLIFSDGFKRSLAARTVKRIVDLVAAASIVVLTAPLCLLVAIAIKLEDGGPVLYRQRRVGLRGALFTLSKFRSMRVDAEDETGPKWAEDDDPRITRIGRWIRALRIDEIPQAWNVLRGDMSFVGPRPERPEFVALLRDTFPYYDYRHGVRPGITGWAQVNFPYGATVEDAREKLEFDLYYLKNFSVLMDVLILVRTVKIIMFGWGSR